MTFLTASADCPSCGSQHKAKPFCIYENGVHCFSCGYTKSYDRTFSIAQETRTKNTNFPELNEMKSHNFSLDNLQWLNKYYVTPELVRKHSIYEAPDGALIFCVTKDGEVVHYQKRYIRENRLILSYGPKTPLITSIGSDTVAIVEDPLSGIRVGEHCDSVCLWGTKTSYEFLKSLLNYKKILVWLDNDHTKQTNSGQVAAKKICNMLESVIRLRLRRYGFGGLEVPEVVNCVTSCDPKCYSPSEIKIIVEGEYVYTAE